MDVQGGGELLPRHVTQGYSPIDAGAVDEDVESTILLDGGIDDGLGAIGRCHGIGLGKGLSAGPANFIDDFLCGTGVATFAVAAHPVVIDDYLGAAGG